MEPLIHFAIFFKLRRSIVFIENFNPLFWLHRSLLLIPFLQNNANISVSYLALLHTFTRRPQPELTHHRL